MTNAASEPPSFQQVSEIACSMEALVERTNEIDVSHVDSEQCLNFFANEWIEYADETRSSIQAYITNMIDPFLVRPYAGMFAGRSDIRIDEVLSQGKILYVDMPIADKEAMAKTIGVFIKFEYFRHVLCSPRKDRYSFFLCDEFQTFFTTGQGKGDADFFERSRESNHVNIVATQNLPALFKQSTQQEHAKSLLGNCAIKIFLRNTDERTNEYASKLFGAQIVSMGGVQSTTGSQGVRGIRGGGVSTTSNDQETRRVHTNQFTELTIPSQKDGLDYAETIIFHGAKAQLNHAKCKHQWKVHPI